MKLRKYIKTDNEPLVKMFYDTVHTVNARDYTAAQLDAWAPRSIDADKWCAGFSNSYTLIAVESDKIVGFANLTDEGYLDRLYVHKDHQRMGIAQRLSDALEAYARNNGIEELFSDVSITAKPFFTKQGYITVKENSVERARQRLVNYTMKKIL